MTTDELKRLAEEYVSKANAAEVAARKFDLAMAEACADRGIAPGHAIDLYGDGTAKPKAACKFLPSPAGAS